MSSPSSNRWRQVFVIAGILMVALNLRPAITSVAPLAERMHAGGLSRQTIGLMTTIPLILFGVAGLWAGWVGRRIGFARALGAGLLILCFGCLLRSVPGPGEPVWRMAGTVLIGAGIALGNVLLPGVVKTRFPNHLGPMTSLYSTGLNLGAALGFAASVPLAEALPGGWPSSLAAWGGMALLTLFIWSPQMLPQPARRPPTHPLASIAELSRQPRAWQITAYMGLQSMVFYAAAAWLPTVLQGRGLSETAAAHWVTYMQILGCAASLLVPTLAGRVKSQSLWAFGCVLTSGLGLTGILTLPAQWTGLAVLVLGLGVNSSFGLALLLIAVRSRDGDTAAGLSSMAQAVGYLIAAPGPWLVGWLFESTDSWAVALGFVIVVAAVASAIGLFAGRPGNLALRNGETQVSV